MKDEMAATMPEFNPNVIEEFAKRLYAKADALAKGALIGGVILGACFGAIPLTPLGDAWPIPQAFGLATMLLGGLCGGMIGYVIGDHRALDYRFQAQMALRQLRVERETALALQTLRQLRVPPAGPAPAQPAAVNAAPVQAPPVRPAPVEVAPVQPAPVQPAPVQAAPLQAAPVDAAPVQLPPVQLPPVQPTPLELAPVQQPPVQPRPAAEAPGAAEPTASIASEHTPAAVAPVAAPPAPVRLAEPRPTSSFLDMPPVSPPVAYEYGGPGTDDE
jgi:hypothetical protein